MLGAARRGEHAVDRGCADREDLLSDASVELQLLVPLECGQKHWNECLETFAADPISGLPQHNQHLTYRFVVEVQSRRLTGTVSASVELSTRIECLR